MEHPERSVTWPLLLGLTMGIGLGQPRSEDHTSGYADDDHPLADGLVDAIVGFVTAT